MVETEVAKPVEDFLSNLGYRVRSEVKGCDITATKDDELIVIECKTSISLKLIYQAVDRLEFSDSVYIAIPLLSGKGIPNRKHLLRLLKRLELGLIIVHVLKTKTRVEVVLEPKEYKPRRKLKKRKSILGEIERRSDNKNTGGTRGKIITAYKESAIFIAEELNKYGPLSAKKLRVLGACEKAHSILYNNFYGWFEKGDKRGEYRLTDKGISAIDS